MRAILILAMMCGTTLRAETVKDVEARAYAIRELEDICKDVMDVRARFAQARDDSIDAKNRILSLLEQLAQVRKDTPKHFDSRESRASGDKKLSEERALVRHITEIVDAYGREDQRIASAQSLLDEALLKLNRVERSRQAYVNDTAIKELLQKAHGDAIARVAPVAVAAQDKAPQPSTIIKLKDGTEMSVASVMETDDSYIVKTDSGMKTLKKVDVAEVKKP